MPSAKMKWLRAKEWYDSKKEEVRETCGNYYAANVEKCKEASKLAYEKNQKGKEICLEKLMHIIQRSSKRLQKKLMLVILTNSKRLTNKHMLMILRNSKKLQKSLC